MCELANHPHCLPCLLPRDVAPFCCMCFLHAYKNRIRLLPCRVASGTEMNLIYGAKKDLTLWPRLRPTHTHTYSLSLPQQKRSTSFVLFRFVLFGSLLFCVSFWICFVRAERGTGGSKDIGKGAFLKSERELRFSQSWL